VGLILLVYSSFLGLTAHISAVGVATADAYEPSYQILDELESVGVSFDDREEAHKAVWAVMLQELSNHDNTDLYYSLAACGLVAIVFGVFPDRKPKQSD
jgi:hypothetical protein